MALNTYLPGNGIRFSVVFRDINGATVDPPTVLCTVRLPDGSTTVDNSPVHDGIAGSGAYHSDFKLPKSTRVPVGAPPFGTSRWESTGTTQQSALVEPKFIVGTLDF
jgi:hypothetical protein